MGPETGDLVHISPADAGWDWAGLHVLRLEPGAMRTVSTGDAEVFVVPLSGGLTLEVADAESPGTTYARYGLAGRTSVFDRVTDFAYVGRDSLIRLISANGAEVAIPSARCERRLEPLYGPAAAVPVAVRGAGPATRQETDLGVPGAWDHAERLIVREILTPGGNWAGYPPHKHDTTAPCEVATEEIILFRVAGPDGVTASREGFALHRTSTGPEHEDAGLSAIDDHLEVRDLDVYCVPHGYHGPTVAAPGYDLYQLSVVAGPTRSDAACDDPAHSWVRDSWPRLAPDPRVPVTGVEARPRP